jgi:hypothetical protein
MARPVLGRVRAHRVLAAGRVDHREILHPLMQVNQAQLVEQPALP